MILQWKRHFPPAIMTVCSESSKVTGRTTSKSVFLPAGALSRGEQHTDGSRWRLPEAFLALHSFWIRLTQSVFVNKQAQDQWGRRTLPGSISEETARLNRDLIFRIEATHFSAYTALLFNFEIVLRELWEKHMERDQKHRQCICEMSNPLSWGIRQTLSMQDLPAFISVSFGPLCFL